jgi:hypothetical protein
MSRLITRLNPVGTSVVALIVLLALVVLSRAPSDGPQPTNAPEATADGQPTEPTGGVETETSEPTLATGCFGTGSTRAEAQAVMGTPDTVVFGAWVYGRSNVTFGYGTVLDYSNEGRDLRLC